MGDAVVYASCASCGQPFVPVKAGHRYCTRECRYRGPREEQPWPDELLWLQLSPDGGPFTAEELRPVWEAWRDRLLSPDYPTLPGTRPWAFWRFDLGEERPVDAWGTEARVEDRHASVLRLADLGLLRDDELAALREQANEARLRIDTPGERRSGNVRIYVEAVALWEAVAARQRRA